MREHLAGAGCARWASQAAVTAASELATNAVVHARTPYEVRIRETDDRLRVGVADRNPRLPTLPPFTPDLVSGRGLHVVEQLAERWGCEPLDDGKLVWFEVPAA